MIGYWHATAFGRANRVPVSLCAHVGGYELMVECSGEHCWHWVVMNHRGHEIEEGTAPDAHTAEEMAEAAAFHIHPPSVGDWVGRLL